MLTAEVPDDLGLGVGIGAVDSLRLQSLEARLDQILLALRSHPATFPRIIVGNGSHIEEEDPLGSHRVLIEEPASFTLAFSRSTRLGVVLSLFLYLP